MVAYHNAFTRHNYCKSSYLPFSFSKVFLNLSTNAIFDVLVWGSISRYPKQQTRTKKAQPLFLDSFLNNIAKINYKRHRKRLLTTHGWWLPVQSVFGPGPHPLNMQLGFLLQFKMVKLNLCFDQNPIDSFQTYCTVIWVLYLNLRCHPNRVSQTRSLQTEFSGTSSYHDYRNRHLLSHHKKVGFLTVCWKW